MVDPLKVLQMKTCPDAIENTNNQQIFQKTCIKSGLTSLQVLILRKKSMIYKSEVSWSSSVTVLDQPAWSAVT
jgi:hypothetical protein